MVANETFGDTTTHDVRFLHDNVTMGFGFVERSRSVDPERRARTIDYAKRAYEVTLMLAASLPLTFEQRAHLERALDLLQAAIQTVM